MRNHFLKNLFWGPAGREQELLKTIVFTSNLEPWLLKAIVFTSISEPRLPKTNVFTTSTGFLTVTFCNPWAGLGPPTHPPTHLTSILAFDLSCCCSWANSFQPHPANPPTPEVPEIPPVDQPKIPSKRHWATFDSSSYARAMRNYARGYARWRRCLCDSGRWSLDGRTS